MATNVTEGGQPQITNAKSFIAYVSGTYSPNSPQRLGQYMMNRLWYIRQDLYNTVVGTDADPFYFC